MRTPINFPTRFETFNRTRVECKSYELSREEFHEISFNRTRVECKSHRTQGAYFLLAF